jgi:hypothetical protein
MLNPFLIQYISKEDTTTFLKLLYNFSTGKCPICDSVLEGIMRKCPKCNILWDVNKVYNDYYLTKFREKK